MICVHLDDIISMLWIVVSGLEVVAILRGCLAEAVVEPGARATMQFLAMAARK